MEVPLPFFDYTSLKVQLLITYFDHEFGTSHYGSRNWKPDFQFRLLRNRNTSDYEGSRPHYHQSRVSEKVPGGCLSLLANLRPSHKNIEWSQFSMTLKSSLALGPPTADFFLRIIASIGTAVLCDHVEMVSVQKLNRTDEL